MNYKKRVLRFNLIFLLCLVIISIAYPKINALTKTGLRAPNIIADILKQPGQHLAIAKKISKAQKKGGVVLKDYVSYSGLINSAGYETALPSFFEKLAQLQKDSSTQIRVAWFGDSFIEGDQITKDFRDSMQRRFGGSGVGFVPVTSVTAGFRQTITQNFSTSWEEPNFKSGNRGEVPVFLSGHSFLSTGSNEINFRSVKMPGLDSFTNMQVLSGRSAANKDSLRLNINGTSHAFPGEDIFNVNNIAVNSKSVRIGLDASDVPLFGFSFESAAGITIDNFSFRGVSGIELGSLDDSLLRTIGRKRPYDLIVIEYGPNLLFKAETVDFSWYERKMQPVLEKLRANFPGADFLLVSTADKAFKYNGEWATQKGVVPLVDLQYKMAEASKMDFFNLYQAMGGDGQMIKWVNAKPALAEKDYTHVTGKGASVIAGYFYAALLKEFAAYQNVQ